VKKEIQGRHKAYARDALQHDPGLKGLKAILEAKREEDGAKLLFFD